jgi:hypothetical protein
VDALKEENKRVQTALHEQVDSRAERAAVRAVERMISFRGERPPEIE